VIKETCAIIVMYVIGASLSEPHIAELAVNFPFIYIYLSYVVP